MDIRLLIDSIVRQTTILIAQLATSGGVRAPLPHIANQVFLDLAKELDAQGVSRKVSADMFGMALRAYQRKLQRLTESSTDRGRSLWEAIMGFISERDLVTRAEVLIRFKRDDEAIVRGVLHDLTESGMVFCSGSGSSAVYRAVSEEELGRMRRFDSTEALDAFLWALVYREGPLSRSALSKLAVIDAKRMDESLQRLERDGRVSKKDRLEDPLYESSEFFVPLNAHAGWEAAVFDHYRALVQTICRKLRDDSAGASANDEVGGSTYTLDIWPGHSLEQEARGVMRRFRQQTGELRARIRAHNKANGMPDHYDQVTVYVGQCITHREPSLETEHSNAF